MNKKLDRFIDQLVLESPFLGIVDYERDSLIFRDELRFETKLKAKVNKISRVDRREKLNIKLRKDGILK